VVQQEPMHPVRPITSRRGESEFRAHS
jgi:hypothetical protein